MERIEILLDKNIDFCGIKMCPSCGKTEFNTSGTLCLRCGYEDIIKHTFIIPKEDDYETR